MSEATTSRRCSPAEQNWNGILGTQSCETGKTIVRSIWTNSTQKPGGCRTKSWRIAAYSVCWLWSNDMIKCKDNPDNFTYSRNVDGYRFSDEEFC